MKQYSNLICILLLFISIKISAQNSSFDITPRTPTSPQAEAMIKRGQFKENNSSGIPDISVPLAEINYHGFKIPISLRYMPRPLRPGYNYDVCGFGWSINTTYCISRTINSLADEEHKFMLDINKIADRDAIQYYKELHKYNLEYDRFKVVLPTGDSFEFVMEREDGSLKYIYQSKTIVDIKCNYNSSSINSFVLTDVSGNVYTFSTAEKSYSKDENFSRNVAWYLDRIDFPDKTPMYFTYSQNIKDNIVQGIEEYILKIGQMDRPVDGYTDGSCFVGSSIGRAPIGEVRKSGLNLVHYNMKLLSSISYGGYFVKFDYENPSVQASYNYLKSIIFSEKRKIVKLQYKKTFSRGLEGNGDPLACLTKVTFLRDSSSTEKLDYSFEYTGVGGFNNGTDHWGNLTTNINPYGMANFKIYVNYDLIKNDYDRSKYTLQGFVLPLQSPQAGGNIPYSAIRLYYGDTCGEFRSASQNPGSHCLLKRMTYPNGGYTQFLFENHKFKTHTLENGDYVFSLDKRRTIEGGGFRIKNILNYKTDGTLVESIRYEYGNDVNGTPCGWGEPVVDPNLLTYTQCSCSSGIRTPIYNLILGVSPDYHIYPGPYGMDSTLTTKIDNRDYFLDPLNDAFLFEFYWEANISPLNFRALLDGRPAVVYPQITEFHEENNSKNKIVYKYDIYKEGPGGDIFYDEPYILKNVVVCERHDYRLDRLIRKEVYGSNPSNYYGINYFEDNSYEDNTIFVGGVCNTHACQPGWFPANTPLGSTLSGKSDYIGFSQLSGCNKTLVTPAGFRDMGSYYYSFNKYNLLTTKSYNEIYPITETYTYSCNTSDTSSVLEEMRQKHIYDALVSTSKLVGNKKVQEKSYQYANFNGEYHPSCVYENIFEGAHPGRKLIAQILSYSRGMPEEIIDEAGVHTVYLWGYNDKELVAIIKNATKAEVSTVLATLGIVDLSKKSFALSIEKIRKLQTLLPNALITGYTYGNISEITAVVNENGHAIYYSYDTLGRLTEEYCYKDDDCKNDKVIIKEYSYHDTKQ